MLDRRPAVFLARRGAGIDHTTAAVKLAPLVASAPGRRILNSADPDTPSGLEIARTIARQLGHAWEEVLLDDGADGALGRQRPAFRACLLPHSSRPRTSADASLHAAVQRRSSL